MPHRRMMDFFARKLAARRIYRQVIDELSHYSERELADIGLQRSDVRRIASESARQTEQAAILESRQRFDQLASHAR